MVSQGRHAANVVPLHGVCMLSYCCTSCQQLVTVSFQGIIPVEFLASFFPCGNSGEKRRIFYVDISPSLTWIITEDISAWKFHKVSWKDIQRVPVVQKYPSDVLMSILWWVEKFTGSGKFPSFLNPEFWDKLRGWICVEISERFFKWPILITPPVCHPANFLGENREVRGFWYIFFKFWIYGGCIPGFPQISPFSISMRQTCTISLWTAHF